MSRALPSAALSRGFFDAVVVTFLSGTMVLGLGVGAAAEGPVSTQNRQISVRGAVQRVLNRTTPSTTSGVHVQAAEGTPGDGEAAVTGGTRFEDLRAAKHVRSGCWQQGGHLLTLLTLWTTEDTQRRW